MTVPLRELSKYVFIDEEDEIVINDALDNQIMRGEYFRLCEYFGDYPVILPVFALYSTDDGLYIDVRMQIPKPETAEKKKEAATNDG